MIEVLGGSGWEKRLERLKDKRETFFMESWSSALSRPQ